jgi:hypothetical protein
VTDYLPPLQPPKKLFSEINYELLLIFLKLEKFYSFNTRPVLKQPIDGSLHDDNHTQGHIPQEYTLINYNLQV